MIDHKAKDIREALQNNCYKVWLVQLTNNLTPTTRVRVIDARTKGSRLQVKTFVGWLTVSDDDQLYQL